MINDVANMPANRNVGQASGGESGRKSAKAGDEPVVGAKSGEEKNSFESALQKAESSEETVGSENNVKEPASEKSSKEMAQTAGEKLAAATVDTVEGDQPAGGASDALTEAVGPRLAEGETVDPAGVPNGELTSDLPRNKDAGEAKAGLEVQARVGANAKATDKASFAESIQLAAAAAAAGLAENKTANPTPQNSATQIAVPGVQGASYQLLATETAAAAQPFMSVKGFNTRSESKAPAGPSLDMPAPTISLKRQTGVSPVGFEVGQQLASTSKGEAAVLNAGDDRSMPRANVSMAESVAAAADKRSANSEQQNAPKLQVNVQPANAPGAEANTAPQLNDAARAAIATTDRAAQMFEMRNAIQNQVTRALEAEMRILNAQAVTTRAAGPDAAAVRSLTLQLHPVGLGRVHAQISKQGDVISIQMSVERASTYEMLKNDMDALRLTLKSLGMTDAEVTLTQGTSSARQDEQQTLSNRGDRDAAFNAQQDDQSSGRSDQNGQDGERLMRDSEVRSDPMPAGIIQDGMTNRVTI